MNNHQLLIIKHLINFYVFANFLIKRESLLYLIQTALILRNTYL